MSARRAPAAHPRLPPSSNQNGVLEVGERVTVDTAWANPSTTDLVLTGTASNLTGPAGPVYTIADASADYGTIVAGGSADCFTATANCYEVEITGTRPPGHCDATFDEALSTGVAKTWTLHVGESLPGRADFEPVLRLHREHLPQRHHGRLRQAATTARRLLGHPRPDGRLPAQVEARLELRPAGLHGRLRRRAVPVRPSPTGSSSSPPKASPAAAAAATTAPTTRSRAPRWPSSF